MAVDAERKVTMSGKAGWAVSVVVVLVGLAVSWNVATANVLAGDDLAMYTGADVKCGELCYGYQCNGQCTGTDYGICQPDPGTRTCNLHVGQPGSGCEGGPQGVYCPKVWCEDV